MPIENCNIHPSVKIWHSELVNIYDSIIGADSSIAAFVEIGVASIGRNCKIGTQVYICPGTMLEGDNFISHGTRFCNIKNPKANFSQRDRLKGAIVKKGAVLEAGGLSLAFKNLTIS